MKKKEELRVGDIVELYNDYTNKWNTFIIMSEEDLDMVKQEYKWRKNYDNEKKFQT